MEVGADILNDKCDLYRHVFATNNKIFKGKIQS